MASEIEMLEIEEFAARMKISRATAYEWLRNNILVEGRHYLRTGRVIRILWNQESIQRFMQDCSNTQEPKEPPLITSRCKLPLAAKKTMKSAINWDYEGG